MERNSTMDYEKGSECNRVRIDGVTELFGDPVKRPEKPHTIILFPGGFVEVARTSDNEYWVHVATRETAPANPGARGSIVNCRLDADGRYCLAANEILRSEIDQGDVNHIAFLVRPQRESCRATKVGEAT